MTSEIRKILFASDLSEHARYVFEHAALLAAYSRARIVVLHVMEELSPGDENRLAKAFGEELYRELKARKKEDARGILVHKRTEAPRIRDFLASQLMDTASGEGISDNDLIENILVVEGQVADEIVAIASEKACDVIVMGSRRQNFLAEAFSGSVVRKVLRRTRKPVYVIPVPD